MKPYIKIILSIILFLYISCERNDKDVEFSGDVLMGLAERFNNETKKIFSLRLVPIQNLLSDEVEFLYRYHKLGNSLYFDLIGSEKYGSPSAEIDLGTLPEGSYSIQINSGSHNNFGILSITDTAYNVSMIKSENVKLMWGHFRRVFDNSLWGVFCYDTEEELNKGLSLLDSLHAFGAQPSTLENGNYVFFTKINDKVEFDMNFVPHYNPNKVISFLFDYNFIDQKIVNLMTRYKYSGGSLYIKVATGKGTNIYNWR